MLLETPHYIFLRLAGTWTFRSVARNRLDALNQWHYFSEVCGWECLVL